MKVCFKCGKEKNESEFSKSKTRKDGRQATCKKCNSEYYQENKEEVLDRERKRYQENKEQILDQKREYYQENRKKRVEYQRKYRQRNRESKR